MAVLALAVQAWPGAEDALEINRAFSRVWSRLWTAYIVHFGGSHLFWNLAIFLPAGIWAERLVPWRTRFFYLVGSPFIGLVLLAFDREMANYRGLSGVAAGGARPAGVGAGSGTPCWCSSRSRSRPKPTRGGRCWPSSIMPRRSPCRSPMWRECFALQSDSCCRARGGGGARVPDGAPGPETISWSPARRGRICCQHGIFRPFFLEEAGAGPLAANCSRGLGPAAANQWRSEIQPDGGAGKT